MKSILTIASLALAACGPTSTPGTAAHAQALRRADRAMTRLLLPNSMARTSPRTQEEIDGLLAEFRDAADEFAKPPEASVRFLLGVVGTTSREDEGLALSALQILYVLDSPAASSVIRGARTHPNGIVARTARSIVELDADLLRGFR